MMPLRQRLQCYADLMRLEKPIGWLLLLWPTLWALWLSSQGHPNSNILLIFMLGVILMRSAGCVLNDIFDRKYDGQVQRTKQRPLPNGRLSVKEALLLAVVLLSLAFILVLFCNRLTIQLAFVGAALALIYPLMKRFTYLPQVGLGLAFSWGVPMAFAAETNHINFTVWFLFITAVIWPVIYDTMYAMVDRPDDTKIGIKSTAILFNTMDKTIIGLLQLLFVFLLAIVGLLFHLRYVFYCFLLLIGLFFVYQQWLIKDRIPTKCFKAFINNNWVGFFIFIGIALNYLT